MNRSTITRNIICGYFNSEEIFTKPTIRHRLQR